MMRCIKDLNYLRLENPALTSENIRFVHEDPGSSILAWLRWSDNCENVLLCVANPGEHDWGGYQYAVSTDWGAEKKWAQVFNSQAAVYGGWDESGTHGELTSDNGGAHSRQRTQVVGDSISNAMKTTV